MGCRADEVHAVNLLRGSSRVYSSIAGMSKQCIDFIVKHEN